MALRQIDDYIKAVNGSLNVKITKDMICSAATARQKYMLYLEEEKKKEKKAFSMKRKSLMEELDDLKAKKKLECEAERLAKSADRYSLKAEKAKNIGEVRQMVAKSNSHRSTSKQKLKEAANVDAAIDVKVQQLKAT